MEKKNIFIIYDNFGLGGVQTKIRDIINYPSLDKSFSAISIHLILKNKSFVTMDHLLENLSCTIHYFSDFFSKRFSIFYLFYLYYLILRYKPSVIFVFMHQPLFYLFFLKKILFWMEFNIILSQDVILSFYNKRPYSFQYPKWWLKYVLQIPSLTIVQTEYNKKEIMTYGVAEEKIKVIPNWVIREVKESPHKIYDFIYCGRFAPEKQLHKMINIIAILKKKLPAIHGYFVGEGSELSKIRVLITQKGLEKNIFIAPYTDDIFTYLHKSKLFLLTSAFENFPMTILEAMKSGAVPVVLAFPGVEEFVRYGKTGFYENTEALIVSKIAYLLQNEKKRQYISNLAKQTVTKYDGRLIQKIWNYLYFYI